MPALSRPDLLLVIDTDARDYQVGVALFQISTNGERKAIGVWSRSINSHENSYAVVEKECLAVMWAIQTLWHYIQGTHFTAYSDQASS